MNDLLIVAGAGLLGGAMNAIAGGGSFVTLPALVAAGVPSLNANATSTVALVPSALATAFAYRKDFQGFDGVSMKTIDRKSTRLNSSHIPLSRMPSSA